MTEITLPPGLGEIDFGALATWTVESTDVVLASCKISLVVHSDDLVSTIWHMAKEAAIAAEHSKNNVVTFLAVQVAASTSSSSTDGAHGAKRARTDDLPFSDDKAASASETVSIA